MKHTRKFSFFIVWLLCIQLLREEKIRACVSRYDQSTWNANSRRNSKRSTSTKNETGDWWCIIKLKRRVVRRVLKVGSEIQLNVHNYLQCWCNWTQPKNAPVFFKSPLKKNSNKTHQKSHSILFLWRMYYEVKNKISNTLVRLIVYFLMKQKEQQRNLKDLKKKRRIILTVWVNSTGYLLQLCKIGVF